MPAAAGRWAGAEVNAGIPEAGLLLLLLLHGGRIGLLLVLVLLPLLAGRTGPLLVLPSGLKGDVLLL